MCPCVVREMLLGLSQVYTCLDTNLLPSCSTFFNLSSKRLIHFSWNFGTEKWKRANTSNQFAVFKTMQFLMKRMEQRTVSMVHYRLWHTGWILNISQFTNMSKFLEVKYTDWSRYGAQIQYDCSYHFWKLSSYLNAHIVNYLHSNLLLFQNRWY